MTHTLSPMIPAELCRVYLKESSQEARKHHLKVSSAELSSRSFPSISQGEVEGAQSELRSIV